MTMSKERTLLHLEYGSVRAINPRAGTVFSEDYLCPNEPNLFGNHSWYFHVMTRRRYQLFEAPEKFWGCFAPSWADGIRGAWADVPVLLRPRVAQNGTDEFFSFLESIAESRHSVFLLRQVKEELASELLAGGCRRYHEDEGIRITN